MRKIFLIITVAVLVSYFAFRTEDKITNFPSLNTGGIVAFGDSLVVGVDGEERGGFVKILSEELGIPIANLGQSGDTTALALARVEDVTSRKPSLTLVLIGGNDYLRRVSKTDTYKNLEEIIKKIHESGSAIVLLGLEDDFEDLAEEYKTFYVPDILEGIWRNPQMMSEDELHPNDLGYKLMVERILKGVPQVFAGRP